MMSKHICDFWQPYLYHKDTYRIKFSRFSLLWGVRYKHLCDFVRTRPKIFLHAKNQPRGSSSFFNQLCTYKHISDMHYTKSLKRLFHSVYKSNVNPYW